MAEIELMDLREAYRAQLAEIQQGRLDIADALQRLHLQEEALRTQELRLNDTYRDLDEKEALYRSKGTFCGTQPCSKFALTRDRSGANDGREQTRCAIEEGCSGCLTLSKRGTCL